MSGVGSSSITSSLLAEKAASFATLSRILGYSSVSILFSCIKTLHEVQEDAMLLPGSSSKQLAPNIPYFPQEVQEDSVLLPGAGVSPANPSLSAAACGGMKN